jgi:pimeloyl-ACP methyl ester carboxylesterase
MVRSRQKQRYSVKRSFIAVLLALGLLLPLSAASVAAADDSSGQRESRGVLSDGRQYRIIVPDNWNGTVLNDLDMVFAADGPAYRALLERGYALSGTARRDQSDLDLSTMVAAQFEVLDIFEKQFGPARRIIQKGGSGGGNVGLVVAEARPAKVDGVIAMCANTPIMHGNIQLDLMFALKALLAPTSGLPLVGMKPESAAEAERLWRQTLDDAQATAQGRARIALAVTLAQWPTGASVAAPTATAPAQPGPDPESVSDIQHAMYRTALEGASIGVWLRTVYDRAGTISWNTGVDYQRFYKNADHDQQRTVQRLYAAAGLGPKQAVDQDLRRINAQPRVAGTKTGVSTWLRWFPQSGRPAVPLLHVSNIGDAAVPIAMADAYSDEVRRQGRTHLYRRAVVDSAGHCNFTTAEHLASVETMMRRLDRGTWANSTRPEVLNAVAKRYGLDGSRFVKYDALDKVNRGFFASRDRFPADDR